jgi:hypothetical protein
MQLESVQNDGEFTRTIIKNVIVLLLKVHCEADTPWGDSYDMITFELGTRQQVVAEKVTQQYNDPRLALIGGFFYKINNVTKRVSFLDIIVNFMYFQILCIK